MQFKISSRRTLSIITLLGFAIFLGVFSHSTLKGPAQSNSAMLIENIAAIPGLEQVNFSLPVRLKIPSIGVDALVEYVGFTPDGAMDTPKERANVAWFNFGPRPGENGSAVIAGHYGWKNGKASAFDNLYKLRKGDILYIEDNKGEIISFVVRDFQSFDPKADASDVFGSPDGKSHLNLITCGGAWDKLYSPIRNKQ